MIDLGEYYGTRYRNVIGKLDGDAIKFYYIHANPCICGLQLYEVNLDMMVKL